MLYWVVHQVYSVVSPDSVNKKKKKKKKKKYVQI